MVVSLKTDLRFPIPGQQGYGDRIIHLWGTDCFYSPDEVTQQFLDMVFAEDSPVVAVIGAHLHFVYDDQLTEKIPQYVFDASFKGTVGVLTVK